MFRIWTTLFPGENQSLSFYVCTLFVAQVLMLCNMLRPTNNILPRCSLFENNGFQNLYLTCTIKESRKPAKNNLWWYKNKETRGASKQWRCHSPRSGGGHVKKGGPGAEPPENWLGPRPGWHCYVYILRT